MKPLYQCQVCGTIADAHVVDALSNHDKDCWFVHRIERRGGIIQVLACPECSTMTHDLILESYTDRIRLGLVPGFH